MLGADLVQLAAALPAQAVARDIVALDEGVGLAGGQMAAHAHQRTQFVLYALHHKSASSGIEDVLRMAGELVATKPEAMDNIDINYAIDKYSYLRGNDPKMIRSPQALEQIRADRQQQAQAQQQAAIAEQLSSGAANLSKAGLMPRGQQPSPA